MTRTFRFADCELDLDQRQLRRSGSVVKLNARYFDALVLLLTERGRLVSKERFFETVWDGVLVGDEALTQCIKTLRRALGDDVRQPRFIETVPKYGYRFIAKVSASEAEVSAGAAADALHLQPPRWSGLLKAFAMALGGMAGGVAAGLIGGLIYGYAVALTQDTATTGAVLVLAAVVALCVLVGAMGALFVSIGLALGELSSAWRAALGAVAGGLAVGGVANLVGLDAFALILGVAPDRITGASEGAALGGAIALAFLAGGPPVRLIVRTALACALASVLIVLASGEMMAGSLDNVAAAVAASDLPLGGLRPFVPLNRLPLMAEVVLAAVEGLVFGAGIAAGLCSFRNGRLLTQSSPVHHANSLSHRIGLLQSLTWRSIVATDIRAGWLGRHRWRIARWLAAALLMLLPFLAMRISADVNWGAEDFIWLAAMVTGFGLLFEVALTWSANVLYRAGIVVALGTSFLLIWVIVAVGFIGSESNSFNLLYFATLAGGALVAAQARFEPRGMVRALLVLAAGQVIAAAIALAVGAGLMHATTVLRLIAATGFFTLLWLAAAALFRRAAREAVPS